MYKRFGFLMSLLAILFFTLGSQAQVPNSGFEDWTAGNPDGWLTPNVPGFFTPITQSANSHSGSSAARGDVVDFSGFLFPPYMIAGDTAPGFPVSQRYANFSGYYQFSPQGTDAMFAWVIMYKDSIGVGAGYSYLPPATSGYASFDIPIQYISGDVPNNCYIEIFAGDTTGTIGGTAGTFFLVDDLTLSGVSGIDLVLDPAVPAEYTLKQNYPNPFNPSTTIEFSLPAAETVSLIVYNSLGQEVERLVNQQRMATGTYRLTWTAENLPSGAYFYRLITGNRVQSRKMMLMK